MELMELNEADFGQFVADIWGGQLGLEAQPGGRKVTPGVDDFLTGWVRITGPWQGAVVLACAVPLARRAAEIMFGVAPQAVTAEQTEDAVSELTNIIGGNIKPLLAPGAFLSTPVLGAGTGDRGGVPAGRPLLDTTFESGGELFQVTVLRQDR